LRLGKMLDRSKNEGDWVQYLRNINIRWFSFALDDLQELRIGQDERENLSIADGDLLICEGGEPGRCAVWRGGSNRLVYQKALHRFRTFGAVLPEWLMYFLKHEAASGRLQDAFTGTTIKHLTKESLGRYAVPVPPVNEQERIADKLDAVLVRVETCRDRLDRVPAILKRFRRAVLAAGASGRLTEDWRRMRGVSDLERRVDLDGDVLSAPVSWDERRLAELIDPLRPLCYGVVQPGPEPVDGVPLIRVQDLDRGMVITADLRTIDHDVDAEYQRSRVCGGEVLVSVVGTIGRTAVVPPGFRGNIARALARVACKDGVVSQWLHVWLNVSEVQWWLTRSCREVARKTLNLKELACLPVAVPSLSEQTEIVRRVEALFAWADRLEARVTAARAQVDRLTLALLAKAFRGELVPQDPADEPAAELLARILRDKGESTSAAGKRGRAPKRKADAHLAPSPLAGEGGG
jgi:type I restriction enzyme, S subunit